MVPAGMGPALRAVALPLRSLLVSRATADT